MPVGEATVVTKPNDAETFRFIIHDFENRKEKRGEWFYTPSLKAFGHDWKLRIYPMGDSSSCTERQFVSIFLHHVGRGPIRAQYTLKGKTTIYCKYASFDTYTSNQNWGWDNAISRDDIPSHIKDGALTLEVNIEKDPVFEGVWYPEALVHEDFLANLYDSRTGTDCTFDVDGRKFKAHRLVLQQRCKVLYDMQDGSGNNDPTYIAGTTKYAFQIILENIYTVKEPAIFGAQDLEKAKEVLVAADRFAVTRVKLLVESDIVSNILSKTNAVSMMFFAESYSCALLKEAAFDLYVEDPKTVKNTEDWEMMKTSLTLMEQLLEYATVTVNNITSTGQDVDLLRVSALRNRLQEKGLDVDGSRETLVKRLKSQNMEVEEDEVEDDTED